MREGILRICLLLFFACLLQGLSLNAEELKMLIFKGNNNPPFTFEDELGNLVGIEIEIIEWIAKDNGFKLMKVNSNYDSNDTRISMLVEKKVDLVIFCMTITDERKKKIDFSKPYHESGVAILVKNDSKIKNNGDLQGKNIYAFKDFTAYNYLINSKELGCNIKSDPLKDDVVALVKEGKLDGLAEDYDYLKYLAAKDKELRVLEKLNVEHWGIGVRKDKPELLKKINTSLDKMKESGELDKIRGKYLNNKKKE